MANSGKERIQERLCYLCLLIVAGHLVVTTASSPLWWGLGVSTLGLTNCGQQPCPSCDNLTLSDSQNTMCKKPDSDGLFRAIARGARKAIIDCQLKFNSSRWNCSTFYGDNLFGSFVNSGTRETAVLYAYLTAGATYGMAKGCHSQEIPGCCVIESSVEDDSGNIIFDDCNDNVAWAANKLNKFAGTPELTPSSTESDLMEIHNTDVGKQSMMGQQTRTCTCHGISGTCSVQTCYERAPDLFEVGEIFKQKYDGATKVKKADNNTLLPALEGTDPPSENDLVYTGTSPTFCDSALDVGVIGTHDRACDPSPSSPNSCAVLCCGRGFHQTTRTVPQEQCGFVWCCRIECRTLGFDEIVETRCN